MVHRHDWSEVTVFVKKDQNGYFQIFVSFEMVRKVKRQKEVLSKTLDFRKHVGILGQVPGNLSTEGRLKVGGVGRHFQQGRHSELIDTLPKILAPNFLKVSRLKSEDLDALILFIWRHSLLGSFEVLSLLPTFWICRQLLLSAITYCLKT